MLRSKELDRETRSTTYLRRLADFASTLLAIHPGRNQRKATPYNNEDQFPQAMRPVCRSRPHRALEIWEVVDVIMTHVASDVRSLLAAARVNRLWADVALGQLWRTPASAALAGTSSHHGPRRAYYGGKVRHLAVVGDYWCSPDNLKAAARLYDLRGWRLWHVTHVSFVRPSLTSPRKAGAAAALLQQVLQAQQPLGRLRAFAWRDDMALSAVAGELASVVAVLLQHAPRLSLRSLALNTVNAAPSAAVLLGLLEALPHLTAVTLEGRGLGDAVVDDAVLEHLAYSSRVELLRVERRISLAMMQRLLRAADVEPRISDDGCESSFTYRRASPFASLTTLGCTVASGAMPLLAAAVDRLTTLNVTLYAGGFAQALDAVATLLTQLHSLSIAFASVHSGGSADAVLNAETDGAVSPFVVRARHITQLSRLSRLRMLQLTPGPTPANTLVRAEWQVIVDGFDDAEFCHLISGLPQLRSLTVNLGATQQLTWRSLRSVGAVCRMLEKLDLGGIFELCYLRLIDDEAPWTLFPCLVRLELRNEYAE